MLNKDEKLMCKTMSKSYRSLFEKLLGIIKDKANAGKTVKDTEFATAKAVIEAEARIKGSFELYNLIIENGE